MHCVHEPLRGACASLRRPNAGSRGAARTAGGISRTKALIHVVPQPHI